MRKMKDSGVAWIGEIPEEWEVKKVKNITQFKNTSGHPKETVLSLYRDYGIVIKSERDDNFNRTSDDTSSYKFVEINDLVVNKMKAWQGSIAVSKYQGIVSPAYQVYKFTTNDVTPFFIHYLLRCTAYHPEYQRLSGGIRVGQWDLSVDDFRKIPVILPSKTEQTAIASFLDKKCTLIDSIANDIERQIEILKQYKQSLITETVTKGLDKNVKMKDSGVEWIGEIPEGWNTKRLKYTVTLRSEKRNCNVNDIYVGLENIESMKANYNLAGTTLDVNLLYDVFKKGDVLFSKLRPYLAKAFLADHSGLCTGELLIFKTFCGYKKYLLYYLLSNGFLECVNASTYGTKMPRASPDYILSLLITLPPLSEQKSIAAFLDSRCAKIDAVITDKQTQLETLKKHKQSLIYEYVTGKKRVPRTNEAET